MNSLQFICQIKKFLGCFGPAIQGTMQDCMKGVKAFWANDKKIDGSSLNGSTCFGGVVDHD